MDARIVVSSSHSTAYCVRGWLLGCHGEIRRLCKVLLIAIGFPWSSILHCRPVFPPTYCIRWPILEESAVAMLRPNDSAKCCSLPFAIGFQWSSILQSCGVFALGCRCLFLGVANYASESPGTRQVVVIVHLLAEHHMNSKWSRQMQDDHNCPTYDASSHWLLE